MIIIFSVGVTLITMGNYLFISIVFNDLALIYIVYKQLLKLFVVILRLFF